MEIFLTGYALLDKITPKLRAVNEGEASEKRVDLWDCVVTEASAALGPDYMLDNEVKSLDYL